MAAFRNDPRSPEPTEKRVVEMTPDGQIVSSQPLETAVDHVPQPQVVQVQPQVIQVKRGGSGALMAVSLVLVLAVAGLGFYIFQTRDDTAALQQAEVQLQQQQVELQQQRAVTEEKLGELGRAADNLGDQVRDTQRDLGIPATPPPAAAQPATTAPATTAPATTAPAQPVQPQTAPQ